MQAATPSVFDADPATQPPVVAVVVTRDPGDWFRRCLESLAAQTYDNLSVVVVDAASTDPVEPLVADVLGDAVVHRLDANPGFASGCNLGAGLVKGAAFYLFCHDDMALEPDAVLSLVAEAFRANAGVVGPKLVGWEDPNRLVAMGMGTDRFGSPVAMVESGELDQGQHDAISEVFFIPGAATLVRADLFAAIDGFDPVITSHGEDLDLCWRARVLGASVVVAPLAVAAHGQVANFVRGDARTRRRQLRHRQRTLRVCTKAPRRWLLVAALAVLSGSDALASAFTGRFARVGDAVGSWVWNLRNRASMRSRRAAVARSRAVGDRDIRAAQVPSSARLRSAARQRATGATPVATTEVADAGAVWRTVAVVGWVVVGVVLVAGSRNLIGDGVPVLGGFVALPGDPGALFASWWEPWRAVGVGSAQVTPPVDLALGALSLVTFGATGAARTLAVLATLPIAALGVWRLAAPLGGPRVRLAALVVAVANPLTYGAISRGAWPALVLIAVLPWVVAHLAHGARLEPFGASGRPLAYHLLAVALLTAVATLWLPAAPLVVLVVAGSIVLGGLVTGNTVGVGRVVVGAVGGAIVAVALVSPWLMGLIGGGRTTTAVAWLGTAAGPASVPGASSLLRFGVASVANMPLGFALLVAALPGLAFGRGWRLAWAARAWLVVIAGWVGAVAIGRGFGGEVTVDVTVVLAPAVMALAVAAAAGVAAMERDLAGYRFGWRQVLSGVAVIAIVVGSLPVVVASLGGRWDAPRRDWSDKLAFVGDSPAEGSGRVLWVSEAGLVPLAGWPLPSGGDDLGVAASLVWATTEGARPGPDQLVTARPTAGDRRIGDALALAAAGGTTRVGEVLGTAGVRWVVVPEQLAPGVDPDPGTTGVPDIDAGIGPGRPVPAAVATITDALTRQLDLSAIPVGGGLRVWENSAWVPVRALYPVDSADGPVPVLTGVPNRPGASGELPEAGDVVVASSFGSGWRLSVNGEEADAEETDDTSVRFSGASAGDATLGVATPLLLRVGTVAVPVLWGLAVWLLVAVRRYQGVPPSGGEGL